MTVQVPALYPIVNLRGEDVREFDRATELALKLAGAGSTLLQLRAKDLPAGPLVSFTAQLKSQLEAYGTQLIVNDRADVAAAAIAAGVHLGDEDLPPVAARRLLGSDAIVGFSTHSLADLAALAADAVDYIGFGPVFESPTKAGVRDPRGLDALRDVCAASPVPVVAIGGVTLDGAQQIFAAGANSCAVIRELEESGDPGALVKEYARLRETAGRQA